MNYTEALEYIHSICWTFTKPGLERISALCEKLAARHAGRIVISGIPRGDTLVNFIYETGRGTSLCVEPRIGADRSGTGDVFASVILGDAVNGVGFAASVRKASRFTAAAVRRSVEMGIPEKDGLAIEEVLSFLAAKNAKSTKEQPAARTKQGI